MTQMYNYKQKQEYLDEIQDNNAILTTTKSIFTKAHVFEMQHNQDICSFKKDEMKEFLSSLNLKESSLRYYRTVLSKYIDYCVDKGLISKNVLRLFTAEDIRSIDTKESHGVDSDTIYELVSPKSNGVNGRYLKNIQDILMIYLIFLGANGNDCHILTKLKIEHVDFKNKLLKLSEIDPEYFDIRVDDLCLHIIKSSRNEKIYRNYEGNDYFTLSNEDYLIRRVDYKGEKDDNPISKASVYSRMEAIRKYIGIKSFTPKNIENAGMYFFSKKVIEKESTDISINNPMLVEHVFNRYKIKNKSLQYQRLSKIKKEFAINDVPS
ncbi:phage lytic cycle repressor MrpR family protein [Oceanobacillus oncorhynchi]|uniref:phage lytic cycle repressor MrpR family protein n=1 Tax=Oceanobacillus oncorhynchi TaxID=545501 RepID=UPI0034D4FC10